MPFMPPTDVGTVIVKRLLPTLSSDYAFSVNAHSYVTNEQ